MSIKIKIGCDPEFFLMNSSGKIVSAEGIVPGDKLNPHVVKKGTIQVDGFAAEIGINPADSAEEFADNVETVLEEIKRYTGDHKFIFKDHNVFGDDVYLGVSDKCRELGCDPDYSAYTKVANPVPVPNPRGLRTAAGHIHIGWGQDLDITDPGHFLDCVAVAKQMDWFLGVPSLAWSKGTVRRSLYGKAGAFRVKPYGMEYRTPDNGWLVSRDRILLMASNAALGMDALYKGQHVYNGFQCQTYINSGNYTEAAMYADKLRIPREKTRKEKEAEAQKIASRASAVKKVA